MSADEKRIAVLIDADNISYRYAKTILDEASTFGIVNVRRIYGDWTDNSLKSWDDVILPHSIRQIQQPGYTTGKNSTDSAMIIDAMDLYYSGNVDGFCLVSSDSDFTGLAMRLRESGMYVVGMGTKVTPEPMIAACNSFKFLDLIYSDAAKESKSTKKKDKKTSEKKEPIPDAKEELIALIKEIVNSKSDEDGWLMLSELQPSIIKRKPEFDVRNYNFGKMTPLIEWLGVFEIRRDEISSGSQNQKTYIVYIRNL